MKGHCSRAFNKFFFGPLYLRDVEQSHLTHTLFFSNSFFITLIPFYGGKKGAAAVHSFTLSSVLCI